MGLNEKEILIMKVHKKSVHWRLQLQFAPGDSTVSVVAPKGRHTRSNPHLPLVTLEVEPENIIKKGKDSQELFSAIVPGTSVHFPYSTFKTLVAISSTPLLPSVEISRNLDLEDFPIEYSYFSPKLK